MSSYNPTVRISTKRIGMLKDMPLLSLNEIGVRNIVSKGKQQNNESLLIFSKILKFVFIVVFRFWKLKKYGCVYAWTTMGSTACDRLTEDADFGKNFIFSDEAHFDFVGYVNKQNCRIWGIENPHAYIENPTHPKRVLC